MTSSTADQGRDNTTSGESVPATEREDDRPDWCQFCGWECRDPDELAIHIADCEPFDD